VELLTADYYVTASAIYFVDGNRVMQYDPLSESVILERESDFDARTVYTLGKGLFVLGNEGIFTYYSNSDFHTFTCLPTSYIIQFAQEIGEYYIIQLQNDLGEVSTRFYDVESCEEMLSLQGSFWLSNAFDNLDLDLIVMHAKGSYQLGERTKLISLPNFEVMPLAYDGDFYSDDVLLRDSIIYIKGSSQSFEGSTLHTLLTYDLSSNEEGQIDLPLDYFGSWVRLGFTEESDHFYLYHQGPFGERFIWEYDISTDTFQIIPNVHEVNAGIEETVTTFQTSENSESFLFAGWSFLGSSLYVASDSDVRPVFDVGVTSDAVYFEGDYHLLVEKDGLLNHIKISRDGEASSTVLDSFCFGCLIRSVATEHAILLENGNYFDVAAESYERLPTPIISTSSLRLLAANDEIVVISSSSSSSSFLFDTKEKTVLSLDTDGRLSAYAMDNEAFLVTGYYYHNDDDRHFDVINKEGQVILSTDVHTDEPLYYRGGWQRSDDIFAIAVPRVDTTLFYIANNDATYTLQCRNEGTLYYRDFPWFVSDGNIYARVQKDGVLTMAKLAEGAETQYFSEFLSTEDIIDMYTTDQMVSFVVRDRVQKKMSIETYDKSSLQLESVLDLSNEVLQYGYKYERLGELVDGNWLFAIESKEYGSELYQLDLLDLTVTLVSDLYAGPGGSNPLHLFSTDEYIYITAHSSDYSRQLYRITRDMLSNSEVVIHELLKFDQLLYPNPTSGLATLPADGPVYSHYLVRDLGGREVVSGKVENQMIDISNLIPGIYFVELIGGQEMSIVQKIIKQ